MIGGTCPDCSQSLRIHAYFIWKISQSKESNRASPVHYNFWSCTVAETWRRVWGGRKNVSRTKISEWRFSRKKFHLHGQKFL